MNNRRRLAYAIGATLTIPQIVFGQPKKPPVIIGWLHGTSSAGQASLAALKEGLAALSYTEGASYVIEARWGEGRLERLPVLAQELNEKKPVIIVTYLNVATRAAANAAPQTPIVQAVGGSPVDFGLAKSLARPGGMVTGLTNLPTELSAKYLELLLAAAPNLKRVGFLIDSTASHGEHLENVRRALSHYRVEGRFAEAGKPEDVPMAVARLAKEEVQGLVLMPSNWLTVERFTIAKLALTNRWPVVAGPRSFAEAGALLSYAADTLALCRRAAYYVDRILKGAKPGELPIEQPTTFEMAVNMRTAKALGLTMPPEIMVRATRVIQ